jgi:hypothetical protein
MNDTEKNFVIPMGVAYRPIMGVGCGGADAKSAKLLPSGRVIVLLTVRR